MTTPSPARTPTYAKPRDEAGRKGFAPGAPPACAHRAPNHAAEGMTFSRAPCLTAGNPLQLAALIRALGPGYALIPSSTAPNCSPPSVAADLAWSHLPQQALAKDTASPGRRRQRPLSLPCLAGANLRTLGHRAPSASWPNVDVRYGGVTFPAVSSLLNKPTPNHCGPRPCPCPPFEFRTPNQTSSSRPCHDALSS